MSLTVGKRFWVFKWILFACSTKPANAAGESCRDLLSHFSLAQVHDHMFLPTVRESILRPIGTVGEGQDSIAIKIEWAGSEAIWIKSKPFPVKSGNTYPIKLTLDKYMNATVANFGPKPIVPDVFARVEGDDGKIQGYIMEFIPFPSLATFNKTSRMNPTQFGQFVQLLRASVRDLHAAGFSHGDLFPGNVLISIVNDSVREVRLIDFQPSQNESESIEADNRDLDRFIWKMGELYGCIA